MSKGLEYVENQIAKLKDDLQHYTMVEKDSALASQIRYDLEQVDIIEKALKECEQHKDFVQEICNYLGLDDLFPYNNLKEIEKQIKTLADNSHWYSVKLMNEKLKALEIIKNVGAIAFILDKWLIQQVITKDQYDLLRDVLL